MCKRNKQPVARTAGACWAPLGALGRLQLAGAAPTPAESPPWAGVSTPPGGCRFRFVGAGRWNAQWGLEEKAPSPPLPLFKGSGGVGPTHGNADLSSNWLPSPARGERPLLGPAGLGAWPPLRPGKGSYLVDPASSHMLVSKIKPCMSKYKLLYTVKLRMAH